VAVTKTAIEGEPPSPVLPPPGCRFNPRCPAAQDICRTEEPQLRAVGEGHFVACHFPTITPVELTLR
jgi:peptide/nickel transport system ATP-binding protein